MEEKVVEKGDAYTMGFVVQKGGSEEVARRTGINRQTMRQVATGRNSPSFDFIMKMIATYPDYDIRSSVRKPKAAASAGVSDQEDYSDQSEVKESALPDVPNQLLVVQNEGLKRENELLRQTVEILRNVVSTQMGKDLESKSESVNDPTRGKQLAIGLNWGIKKVENSMIKIPFTSVRPMSRTWPYPVRRQP
ncbi:hypothetical protein [Spirosoma horti]